MNTLLIDDEPAALSQLSRLLEKHCPAVRVVDTAPNVDEALELIKKEKPDLLFLDVQMPGATGFDLIDRLPRGQRPEVIFVTSETKYAIRAIKKSALDYLLKPVDTRELVEAVARASERIKLKNSEKRLDNLLKNLKDPNAKDRKISIPSHGGMEIIEVRQITHLTGEDRCTRVRLAGGRSLLSSYSIGEFDRIYGQDDFIKVHRSYLVNPDHCRKFHTSGELELSDGSRVPVSRRLQPEVRKRLLDQNKNRS